MYVPCSVPMHLAHSQIKHRFNLRLWARAHPTWPPYKTHPCDSFSACVRAQNHSANTKKLPRPHILYVARVQSTIFAKGMSQWPSESARTPFHPRGAPARGWAPTPSVRNPRRPAVAPTASSWRHRPVLRHPRLCRAKVALGYLIFGLWRRFTTPMRRCEIPVGGRHCRSSTHAVFGSNGQTIPQGANSRRNSNRT